MIHNTINILMTEKNTLTLALRVPAGIERRIKEDVETYGDHRTLSEFVLDSIKWYLDYRDNQRIEKAKSKTIVTKSDLDA